MVGFLALRARLLDALRRRIRSGDITERGLARKVGLSQPHVHNVLKGIRTLNGETADQFMQNLGMNVTDLIEKDELRRALFLILKNSEPLVEVPVLHRRIGPGLAWSEQTSPFERIDVPWLRMKEVENPLVARLAPDPAMEPLLGAGDMVLLDRTEEGRCSRDPDDLFVLESEGLVRVRWIRRGRNRLYVFGMSTRQSPNRWEVVEHAIVRARAIPLRAMYPTELVYDPLLPPRDILPGPSRRSGAN